MVNVDVLIKERFEKLSPQQQRAAGFLLDHLADVAIYDSGELADMSGVSKATMSRLVRTLGFPDWRALREHVRELRHAGAPRQIDIGVDVITKHEATEIANLRAFFASCTPETVNQAAELIVKARRVLVMGFRNSYPIALQLREQLSQLRTGIAIAPAPGQSLGEDLAAIGPDDLVILVGLQRRPEIFPHLFQGLSKAKVPMVLIADSSARRYGKNAAVYFEVCLESAGSLSSYTTAMSVACVLENAVAALDVNRSGRHTDAINAWFDQLGEIEVPW